MHSIALTDHGVLYGAGEFWKMSHDFHIKPIIGCEIYVSPKERTLREPVNGINYYHLVLLAKDLVGYKNLVKIVTIGQLEGMYYRPRVDRETLSKYSEGIICSSACLAGPLSRHIIRGEPDQALDWLKFLHNTYKENFFLELQRNGYKGKDEITDAIVQQYDEETLRMLTEQIQVNNKLREYSEQFKIPLIATTDAHYLNSDDRDVQTILFCIKDGMKLDDPGKRNGYIETYIKTPEEMYEHFTDDTTPLENTLKIADMVEEYSLKFDRVQPRYLDLPADTTAKEELQRQAYEGAKIKYHELTDDLKKRIDYELMVIDKKGYNDYFLVVGDLMQYARKQGIVIGVRGSAAGCVVSYCLDVTNIDPIKWELYFERFLNLERPSPPDIDMDLQDNRREEVLDYARRKYGEYNVASICAMGSLQTKAAIRDVARVMNIDLKIADTLSKKVQVVFGKVFPIEKMMEVDPEFKAIINGDPKLQQLKEYVKRIEGLSRHVSTHAAGYLITPEPINEYMALQRDSKDPDKIMTQMDGTWIDKLDYMKFDFLGLRTLTIIRNAIDLIKTHHNVAIDLKKIPDDDPKAFALFGRGETVGVFQFESPPMQQYLRDLRPETLEDICFLAAAYRPGPMKYIPDYIKCRHGEKQPEYLIPELEPILSKTYGFPIYQEQLLRICMELGGFTMGDGDVIRNALKKKQLDILQAKEPDFKKSFMDKFKYDKKTADALWDHLTPFADYGFNKAHSASYAVVAYWCAYLKGNYPLEFMAALMMSDLESTDRIVVDLREAKRMGYTLLLPDINKSNVYFSSENEDSIRFGLGAIKNVGVKICEEIVAERERGGLYTSLDNLVMRLGTGKLTKKVVEYMVKAGALNEFGNQNALVEVISRVFDKVGKNQHAEKIGQGSLFALDTAVDKHLHSEVTILPEVPEVSEKDTLTWEKELLGVYLSNHPLDQFLHLYTSREITSLSNAKHVAEGKKIKTLAIITKVRTTYTKKDSKPMAMLQLEDMETRGEAVIFPKSYAAQLEKLIENRPLVLSGTVNIRNEALNLIVDEIIDVDAIGNTSQEFVIDICAEKDKDEIEKIKQAIAHHPGTMPLRIIYGSVTDKREIIRNVSPVKEMMEVIRKYRV